MLINSSAFLGDMKTLLFLFVIIYSASVVCLAQNDYATVKADPNACELNSLYFDVIRNELANNPLAKVTAKFYAGKSENNITSKKRADYVQKFLQQYKGFDPSRLEFVDSGKLNTDENPKIEFYVVQPGEVEGKLNLLTYAQPNRTPCLDCCGDERVYPQYIGNKPKKKKVTKQKKKRKIIKTRRTNTMDVRQKQRLFITSSFAFRLARSRFLPTSSQPLNDKFLLFNYKTNLPQMTQIALHL